MCNWVTVCDDVPYINSQMPTQNYKNNYTNKYLEPQTRTSLKKNIFYVHDEKYVEKDVWIMNEISNSIVYKFVSNKDKRKR